MTRISFIQEGQSLRGFEAMGHTGFAERGSDIVCAAVSGVLLTALTGLTEVIGLKCRVTRRDAKGYLKVTLSRTAEKSTLRDAELILEVARTGLARIADDYPAAIRIDIRRWRA